MSLLLLTVTEGAFMLLIAIISLIILFQIIRFAVQAGSKRLHDQLVIQNRLLVEQLKREGVDQERIKVLIETPTMQVEEKRN